MIMDVAVTKMSSKGQIVIPLEMRGNIAEGDKLVLIKNEGQIIMKKAGDLGKNFEEDLIFARRTEQALQRYEAGKFKTVPADEFVKRLKKC
jgi:AbrB family looped-hinge helix DNA binding protein